MDQSIISHIAHRKRQCQPCFGLEGCGGVELVYEGVSGGCGWVRGGVLSFFFLFCFCCKFCVVRGGGYVWAYMEMFIVGFVQYSI